MLKTRTGNCGRRRWAPRSGAAALALAAVAAWMSACGDDPAGIAPGTTGITAVADGVSATAQFSVASQDRAVLEALYHATGGPDWTKSDNWLTDAPLNEWHGVTTDSVGRVVILDLSDNRLTGDIPAELGNLDSLELLCLQRNRLTGDIPAELGGLARLELLYLHHNRLTGSIPAELGDLARLEGLFLHSNPELSGSLPLALASLSGLQSFRYDATGVCVPADESFRAWLDAIPKHRGTGVNCAAANPDRAALAVLYEATRGAGWVENEGWLSDLPLGEWHGVSTGDDGRVTALRLGANNLVGSIPPALGSLTRLETLDLERNALAGPIPPALGRLAGLTSLNLGVNRLTRIPPELGALANLEILRLRRNLLAGPVPPELGNLRNLRTLGLERNRLTGSIPPGFLELERVQSLHFEINDGLCVSGSTDFRTWLAKLQIYAGPLCDERDRAVLASLYGSAGGTGWSRSDGWLGDGGLDDWHGIDADALGRVVGIDLSDNGMTGRVSSSLASLDGLTSLKIGGNADLGGPLPLSLSALSLRELHYADTGLCTSPAPSFGEWLDAIPSHEGTGTECAALTDRDILALFYEATGGSRWTESEHWLSDRPLGEWHGVTTNNDGDVIYLYLRDNNLNGVIPPELGGLSSLRDLRLGSNHLTGPVPPELGDLSDLALLILGSNDLAGPIPPELGKLSSLVTGLDLSSNGLTGPVPPELGDLSTLKSLNLSSNDLTGPIPPELGDLAALTKLNLSSNDLTTIPPELGDLTSLTDLSIDRNRLTAIPPELGDLSALTWLSLRSNDLRGAIPPELGSLTSLIRLYLDGNRLTTIPSELGGLSSLVTLWLQDNSLTGPIPSELGRLTSLEALRLYDNRLTGPIPPELGSLSALRSLTLMRNRLTGPLPAELGNLGSLIWLHLTDNPGLSGPLPPDMASLGGLWELLLNGTDLCAPADAGLQEWLSRLRMAQVRRCDTAQGSGAYLVQAIQSTEFPVPLVAGDPALLRVFVTASRSTSAGIPPMRATFYVDGTETHVADIPGSGTPIPTSVDDAEASLEKSANIGIPGSVIQPGLEFVVEVDPANELDSGLGVTRRIPETGRAEVRVEAVPTLDVTFVPFVWAAGSDASIVDIVAAMAADPHGHELLSDTRTLMPVGYLDVKAHEPILTSTTNVFTLHGESRLARTLEGGTGYYHGIIPEYVIGGRSGLGDIGGFIATSSATPYVIAHEFGHNFSLRHAPCGGAGGPDPSFPQDNGTIGDWGYDFRGGGALVSPNAPDLMGYCGPPRWISGYGFTRATNRRLRTEAGAEAYAGASSGARSAVAPTRTLLLWGGVDAHGQPFLEPAFVLDAPPAVPHSPGEYELAGRAAGGEELFTLSFGMPELADGDGSSSFVFTIPVQDEWAGELASLTLSGPGGSTTMDGTTDRPMAIVRDPASGQLRGVLRDPSPADMAGSGVATAMGRGESMEVAVSRGIPRDGDWTRK